MRTPIDYLDNLTSSKHILLLYEDIERARMIMFRFIKNGLTNGEECVYATEEDSGSIVVKMLMYGIPLQYFHTKQLRVLQISNRSDKSENESCRRDMVMIQIGLKKPYRIVSRMSPNVCTMNGISAELEIERNTQDQFDELGGSIICPYDVSKIEPKQRRVWLDTLRETHHTIIHVPKIGESGVFCT